MADANTEWTARAVRRLEEVDEGLFVLTLAGGGIRFTPGDSVALQDASGASRPYSIASGTDEEALRFLIRVFPDGQVSPWLTTRKPGDSVQISAPFGWFRPGQSEPGERSVCLATGTGIAPFLSAARSRAIPDGALLLYGLRYLRQAIGLDAFEGTCTVRLALSRETRAGHHRGHISELLQGLEDTPHTHYYLCGLETMIADLSHALEARGVPMFRMHREVFFHEGESA